MSPSAAHVEQTLVPCLPHVIHVAAHFTTPGEWLGHVKLEYCQTDTKEPFTQVLVPVYAKCVKDLVSEAIASL